MFQRAELARLRAEKELLVLQSRANRLRLLSEWNRLRSPEVWLNEAGQSARRHPILMAALAAAGGVLAIRLVRKPSAVFGGIGKLGKFATLAFTALKFMRRNDAGEGNAEG